MPSDPNRDLAAAVGVSPTTALDRTRALRQRQIIRGALLDVDLAAIGRPVQALIAIRVRPPADVRTSIVYEHIRNNRIAPAGD